MKNAEAIETCDRIDEKLDKAGAALHAAQALVDNLVLILSKAAADERAPAISEEVVEEEFVRTNDMRHPV